LYKEGKKWKIFYFTYAFFLKVLDRDQYEKKWAEINSIDENQIINQFYYVKYKTIEKK